MRNKKNNGFRMQLIVPIIFVVLLVITFLLYILKNRSVVNGEMPERVHDNVLSSVDNDLFASNTAGDRKDLLLDISNSKDNGYAQYAYDLMQNLVAGKYDRFIEELNTTELENYGIVVKENNDSFITKLMEIHEQILKYDELMVYSVNRVRDYAYVNMEFVNRIDGDDILYDYDNALEISFTVYKRNGSFQYLPWEVGFTSTYAIEYGFIPENSAVEGQDSGLFTIQDDEGNERDVYVPEGSVYLGNGNILKDSDKVQKALGLDDEQFEEYRKAYLEAHPEYSEDIDDEMVEKEVGAESE